MLVSAQTIDRGQLLNCEQWLVIVSFPKMTKLSFKCRGDQHNNMLVNDQIWPTRPMSTNYYRLVYSPVKWSHFASHSCTMLERCWFQLISADCLQNLSKDRQIISADSNYVITLADVSQLLFTSARVFLFSWCHLYFLKWVHAERVVEIMQKTVCSCILLLYTRSQNPKFESWF